jgi:hypothetical protein
MALIRKKEPVQVDADPGAVDKIVQTLFEIGLDGLGPFSTAQELGDASLAATGDAEKAVARVARRGLAKGGANGFVTGLGGFFTLPIALPANVAVFYLNATRMVGAIAHLRGYDVNDPAVRSAILLCLVGADADEVLRKAQMVTKTGAATTMATNVALKGLPPAALMVVNKAVGFKLAQGLGEKALASLGRAVPLGGGLIGGGIDTVMTKVIASHAMGEFPATWRGVSRGPQPE